MERCEQVCIEGIPQAKFGRSAATKERPHVQAVTAFGGSCQTKQLTRVEVVQDPAVGLRFCVVKLVDDDDSVGTCGDVGDAVSRQ